MPRMSYNSFLLSLFQDNFENLEIIDALVNTNTTLPSIFATFFFFALLYLSISTFRLYFAQKDTFFLKSGLLFLFSFLILPYGTIAMTSPYLQVTKKDMIGTNYFNSLSDTDKAYFNYKMNTINEFSRLEVDDELTLKEALTGFDGKYSSKIYLSDLDKVMTEIKARNTFN